MRKLFTFFSLAITAFIAIPASAQTQMNWDQEYSLITKGDKDFEFQGKGTAAKIITNGTDDLTIGTDGLLFQGNNAISVTGSNDGSGYVYITPELTNGTTYNIQFYCSATSSKPFKIKIEEYSGTGNVKEPIKVAEGGVQTWNNEQVYYYEATASGTVKITNEYSPGSISNNSIVYTDADHQNLLNNVTVGSANGFPSYEFEVEKDKTYYFYFATPNYMMITLTFTEAQEPTPEVQAQEIIPGQGFEVSSEKPLWSYTPSAIVPYFYFTCESTYNIFEEDEVVFSKDAEGNEFVMLTPYPTANGEYVYAGSDLEASTPYYIVFKGDEYTTLNMDLVLQEYVVPEVVTLESMFEVSSTKTSYIYNNAEEGDYYITSNSNINLLEAGSLKIETFGSNIFSSPDVKAVEGENGLVYNGIVFQEDAIYSIEYKGSETIELIIFKGTYTPEGGTKYIENYATPYEFTIDADDAYSSIEINWGTEVSLVKDNFVISIYDMDDEEVGSLTAQYVQLVGAGANEPGIDDPSVPVPDSVMTLAAETGDEGTIFVILTGASKLFTEPGRYLLIIPEGIVANEEGAVNKEQTVTVDVIALAKGTVKPEDGAVFAEGEEVKFIITFENDVTINDDAEKVLYVFSDPDYTLELDWSNAGKLVYRDSDAKSIVITLGNELPIGFYQMTFFEGAVTVDELENAMVEINFEVADETEGISSIEAALKACEPIYNLQGQKVKNPTKGLYIINGKKVMIK